jgi:type IV secretory pathway VirB3-like protein
MLSGCGHRRHGVWVVLLLVPLARRILLLGVERRRRGVVVGIRVDMHGRLHRRAVLVLLLVVVLLLTARLLMVWDRVARAHWMVVHGDSGEEGRSRGSSCWRALVSSPELPLEREES